MEMIGEQVGSYRIAGKLGEGGMGVVYLAEHPLIGQKAAVKMLLPEYSTNRDVLDRFFNEARATSQFKHPGIVQIFDFGIHPASGRAYIIMELLEGESLSQRLERERPLSVGLTLEISRQVAQALAIAHAKGIIHRDLKPDNVFLGPAPDLPCGFRTKLLDFGIAKLSDGGVGKTKTSAIIGTPAYMSPEQCQSSARVDQRADIYSLGCMMYEMASGRTPFVADGVTALLIAQVTAEPPPLDGQTDPQLGAVILRALAKDPVRRQQSMVDLACDLERLIGGRPSTGPYLPRVSQGGAETVHRSERPTTLGQAAAEMQRRRSPGRARWLVPVISLGIAVVGVGAFLTRSAPARAPVVPAAPPPPPAPVATPRQVTLKVDSEPVGAEVFRASDGIRVGATPLASKLPATEGEAVFLIKLEGYEDSRVALDASRDGSRTITLVRKPAAAPHATRPPKAPKAHPPKSGEVRNTAYDPFKGEGRR